MHSPSLRADSLAFLLLLAVMQVAELHLWRRRRGEHGEEASYLAAVVREKRSLLGERLLDVNRTLLPLADATHARACAAWSARQRETPEVEVVVSRASGGAVLACVDEHGDPVLIPIDVPAAAVDCLQAIIGVGDVFTCAPSSLGCLRAMYDMHSVTAGRAWSGSAAPRVLPCDGRAHLSPRVADSVRTLGRAGLRRDRAGPGAAPG